jgi:hypothetical protein
MKGALVEVVYYSGVVILKVIKLLSYTFIFPKQLYFIFSGLKIVGHGNPDNNFESSCTLKLGTNRLAKSFSYITWLKHLLT